MISAFLFALPAAKFIIKRQGLLINPQRACYALALLRHFEGKGKHLLALVDDALAFPDIIQRANLTN
jgi:hypothetical protein